MKMIEKKTRGIVWHKLSFKYTSIKMRASYSKGLGTISFQFNNNDMIQIPADEILNILSEAKKANE